MNLGPHPTIDCDAKTEEALRTVAQGLNGTIGRAFFQHLVRHLADTLQADYVFIGELKPPAEVKHIENGADDVPHPREDETPPGIRTLAVWALGHAAENFEYPLAGTPCETVVNRELCCYPREIQQQFPQDRLLAELGAESYVGAPLFDSAGRPLGLMAVLYCHPLDDCRTIESLLQIFAGRAAAEIDRQQVDQRLRDRERHFRSIIDKIGVGILQVSASGQTIYANPAACELFELDRMDHLVREDYKAFFTPESWETILQEIKDRPQGASSNYEVEIIGNRGGRRRAIIYGAPLFDRTGQLESYLATYTDVTGQKRAEENLRGVETRYQTLAEVSPVGIFRTDAHGTMVYANGRALRMIGQPLAEVLQPTWDPPLYPEDRQRHQSAWRAAIATGVPLYCEHRFLRPDDTIVWVVCQAVAERQPDGKVAGFVGTLTDITQLKRAEDLLRQSEHRNRLLVETARDVIFTLAPDRTITSLSPAFKIITGYEVADWLGKAFQSLVHPDDLALSTDMIGRCLQGESSPVHEARIRKQSGDYAIGEFTLTLLLEGGGVTGVLGIGRDITDRKRLEDQYRQSQKMEAIGQLAGGVAHDFNNLLTVITGNAELLLEGSKLESRQTHECLQDIKQAGLKAAALTRQLLAFSRKQLMAPEVLDLNYLITNLQKMLRRLIGEDVNLTTDLAPELWRVKADPGQIEQVLLNLAVNSRDAMPQGGRLSISTANAVLGADCPGVSSLFHPGDFVMLAVEDTGCGMDETTQSHIFEPFFTTKEIGKGTGLGLATVYGIVSQSNGHIDVSSQMGRGATFRIYLPRYRKPEAPSAGPTIETEDGQTLPPELRGTETVLLVEDEEMVRSLARDILRQAGHTVLEARHGTEAVRICEQYGAPIHLIVTDVIMPEMGGIELIRRIRTLRPPVKFLYVSGYTDDALIRQGVRTEEVCYLPKPFTRNDLIRKVREILDR